MSQFYTTEQMNALGTFLGKELKQTRSLLPNPATNYDSFILALDKAIEGDEAILCTPTSLSFIPNVTLPSDKDRVILRFKLEIDGVSISSGSDYDNNYGDTYQDLRIDRANIDYWSNQKETDYNTPHMLANYLFLDYMGLQPTRNGVLEFTPGNALQGEAPLYIGGRSYEDLVREFGNDISKTLTKANVKLTLMLIDNLPADAVDYVTEQWGKEMVVEGCGYYKDNHDNTAS